MREVVGVGVGVCGGVCYIAAWIAVSGFVLGDNGRVEFLWGGVGVGLRE